jgi:threonine dehydrogenase-like Zn-dependent dehydrogenase
VVREFRQPLIIEDRPVPEPGDGQVLVKIEASGLCHTDTHAILTGEGPLRVDAGPRRSSPPIGREPTWTWSLILRTPLAVGRVPEPAVR